MLQHPFGSITRHTRFLSRVVAWIGNGVQLHRPVTQRVVYTKTILHRADFTHLNSKLCADQLCKKTSFYNDIFFYTDSLWHRATFTRETLCTEQLLHGTFFYNQRPFYTQALSRKPGFAQSSFCTKTLWRRAASSQRSVHTHMFDTETFYTCPKLQEIAVKIASMLSSWAGPKIYMLDCKNARNNCIYIVFVAKSA